MKVDLKGLDEREAEQWALANGLEAYRSRQIRHWLFKKFADSFEEMTDLSKPLRAAIKEKARLNHLERVKTQISQDGTEKYLFRLADGLHIESVLIPARDHLTLCISSQVGCAMGCRFCLTSREGLKRNLTSAEIIDQVIQVRKNLENPEKLTNIVFMGMGEPLANYDQVMKATKNLICDDGMNFSHRKVTLSTCGLVPQIEKMGRDTTLNLAISLNGADDDTRNRLMPINRTYPLKDLLAACRNFPLPNRRMITFEYILIAGINDRDQDALNLMKRLSGLRAKINLIPLNPLPISDMQPPPLERILHFQEILIRHHFTAMIRKSRGRDILAACGQLSGAMSREASPGGERIRG
ncbi:MAG: 23S rRNA (adenine(2503)-C(2))-methyltransferase RlmN [Desulfatiglans sp.]|jgi:23S rRNA (adenine2503-C2)-methyltransferase|nr:23S rRNA (adenine(2503)-C(2))-methyltransferase RlmN [Thermodesulfobacteriota bacterium]MEE4351623.1 23S rRNA (adenine(2503)-C(2))-methyltransferase RlmN [Desulfatiglans sp.]